MTCGTAITYWKFSLISFTAFLTVTSFCIYFNTQTSFLHYSHILLLILLAALTLCSALLSDLVGRVKVLFFAFAFAIFASYPALIILDSGSLLGFIAGNLLQFRVHDLLGYECLNSILAWLYSDIKIAILQSLNLQ